MARRDGVSVVPANNEAGAAFVLLPARVTGNIPASRAPPPPLSMATTSEVFWMFTFRVDRGLFRADARIPDSFTGVALAPNFGGAENFPGGAHRVRGFE